MVPGTSFAILQTMYQYGIRYLMVPGTSFAVLQIMYQGPLGNGYRMKEHS